MVSTDSSTAAPKQPQLPPGFRFHPTDEELVVHYLKRKAQSTPLPVAIIAEVDLYKFDPWELPAKAAFGEQEWYFFSPRDRKYPNGARPNRAATSGYWKATGTDKPVLTSGGTQKVGVKKALVFYGGKPPRGIKTNWIMHEYRLADNKPNNRPPNCVLGNQKGSLRLDDWVLCRIYKKNSTHRSIMDHEREDSADDVNISGSTATVGQPKALSYGALLGGDAHQLFDGMLVGDGTNADSMSHQMAASTSKQDAIPLAPSISSPALPLKRTLQSLYWREEDSASGSFAVKRALHGSSNSEENGNNSLSSLLINQLPVQTPPLQQQSILGALGEGLFRQPYQLPGLNWYS
ncbi:hypothetical protein Nepgr_016232 [Nepenthes gracilis]|uniref:NAC domain-containing protein n=1 Tax=Nepenthes gracilis TaxID=150966 RepID=A0AAD3SQ43_NEPGR|nr:hypothetical protein Nepgr_016232 [Nepenthes gracilis]